MITIATAVLTDGSVHLMTISNEYPAKLDGAPAQAMLNIKRDYEYGVLREIRFKTYGKDLQCYEYKSYRYNNDQ